MSDEYQAVGARWLASMRFALLADDMGLGKSKQAVEAAELIGATKILVICPSVAKVNWKREFERWALTLEGFTVCFGKDDSPTDRCIVSYDYATEHRERLTAIAWDVVINDEAHLVKEPEAKRTKAIYGLKPPGIVRFTKRMWDLSGTPAPNGHVGELWVKLFTYGFTKLGYDDFVDRYCRTKATYANGKRLKKIMGNRSSRIPEIKEILSKFMLRRMKADVLKDLPPITYEPYAIEGTPLHHILADQQEEVLYKGETDFVKEVMNRGGSNVLAGIADSVSTLRRINGLRKLDPVCEIIAHELSVGAYDKIILFGIHRDVVQGVEERLREFGSVSIHGGTSDKRRQEAIDGFQNDSAIRVFSGNIQAAGTNLTSPRPPKWASSRNRGFRPRTHRPSCGPTAAVKPALSGSGCSPSTTASMKRSHE
jgi:SWI/SNF-related matrix-associated actin-dependent regulator 1 of chromatin subfamily A